MWNLQRISTWVWAQMWRITKVLVSFCWLVSAYISLLIIQNFDPLLKEWTNIIYFTSDIEITTRYVELLWERKCGPTYPIILSYTKFEDNLFHVSNAMRLMINWNVNPLWGGIRSSGQILLHLVLAEILGCAKFEVLNILMLILTLCGGGTRGRLLIHCSWRIPAA